MPQPLENNLSSEAIIDQSVVIGDGHKFAAALIFPNPEHLRILGRTLGLPANTSLPDLCSNEQVIKQVGLLVHRANEGLPHWSTIKRFSIVPRELTVENELLTPTLKVKRSAVKARFLSEIEALYQDENAEDLQDTTS